MLIRPRYQRSDRIAFPIQVQSPRNMAGRVDLLERRLSELERRFGELERRLEVSQSRPGLPHGPLRSPQLRPSLDAVGPYGGFETPFAESDVVTTSRHLLRQASAFPNQIPPRSNDGALISHPPPKHSRAILMRKPRAQTPLPVPNPSNQRDKRTGPATGRALPDRFESVLSASR